MRWLDSQMFRFASYLLPAQSQSNDFRVIQLDEARLQKPQGIQEFRYLLRKLRKSHAAEIVWLSDDFPQMDYIPVEVEKNSKSINKSTTDMDALEQEWQPTEGERNKLAWMLENQHVFLTQYTNTPQQQNTVTYNESLLYQDGWRQYIPDLFLPHMQTFRVTNTKLPYRVYPFNYDASGELSLIWYDQSKSFSLPDLSLAVFSRYQKSRFLNWEESGKIDVGGLQIPTGLSGKVYSYFSSLTDRHTKLNTLNLQAATKKSNAFYKNKMILIGQDLSQLQVLADSISNIDAGATYHTPSISWWVLPLCMLGVVVYLIWLLPLLSKQSGIFLGAFFNTGCNYISTSIVNT